MKKIALMAVCLGSMGLLACGGGGDDGPDIMLPDGGGGGNPDGGQSQACNPVANTGCPSGQKCTYIVESTDPFLGQTACAPEGGVAEGATCARNEDGNDDCMGTLWCLNGADGPTCQEICSSAPDSCGSADSVCVQFSDLFDDVDNTGICQDACNPALADDGCPAGEGCYLIISSGKGTCAPPAGGLLSTGTNCGGTAGTQGCDCEFLNGCAEGFGCVLNNDPMNATGLVCSFFCDTTAAGGPTCTDGPGPSFSCRRVMTFYSNTESVPEEVGMCVDGTIYPCAGCTNNTDTGCDDTTCMPSM